MKGRPRLAITVGLLLILCSTVPPARADAWLQDGRPAPFHPSVITAAFKGKTYAVIGASAEFPRIEVEGQSHTLYAKQTYQPVRAVQYAPGFVSISGQNATAIWSTMVVNWHTNESTTVNQTLPADKPTYSGNYTCTVRAREAHPDCFVAVIFFTLGLDGKPDPASMALAFRSIGDLPPAVDTVVKINCSYVDPSGDRFYSFPLVFSQGREVRSDQSPIADQFFRGQELQAHQRILEGYRQKFPTADRPAVAYLRIPLTLPEGVDPHSVPAGLKARFAVTESGEVDGVYLGEGLDSKVSEQLTRELNGWLFLPKLKQGIPARARIEIPLSFG